MLSTYCDVNESLRNMITAMVSNKLKGAWNRHTNFLSPQNKTKSNYVMEDKISQNMEKGERVAGQEGVTSLQTYPYPLDSCLV